MKNSIFISFVLILSCTKMEQNHNEYIFYRMVKDNLKYDYRRNEINFEHQDNVLLKDIFEDAKKIYASNYKNEIADSIESSGFDFCQFKPETGKDNYTIFSNKEGEIINIRQNIKNDQNTYNLDLKIYHSSSYILLFPFINGKIIIGFLYLNKTTNRLYFISASQINMTHLYEFPSSINTIMLLDKDLYPNRFLKFNQGNLIYISFPVYENNTTNMVSEYVLINKEKNITQKLSNTTRISNIDFYLKDTEWSYPLGDIFIADVNKITTPIWFQHGNHQYSSLVNY